MKEGWKMVKLGEVCESRLGKTLNSLTDVGKPYNYLCSVNIQWDIIDLSVLKTTLFTDDEIEKYRIQKGDLLVCEGGEAGRSAIWENEEPILYQNALHRIRFKNGVMIPRFCLHYLRKIKNDGTIDKDFARGATIKHLVTKSLYSIPIPLPPLEEQHRIVSILDASFEKIDALKKNAQENLKNAKALFQQVLAQELKPKEGWVEKKLGEICKIKGGKRLPKGESISVEPTPYKYIRVADFRDNGTVIVDDVLYINETTYKQISQYTISSKDVYISIAGTIGKTGIIPEELEGANLTENACKLVLGNMINKRFLYYNTLSQYFKEQIKKGTKITAQPKLALNRLSEIIIPFPTDIDQQRKIVRTLDTLSEKCRLLEEVAQQTIRECDALKQSILRQAFSGEL